MVHGIGLHGKLDFKGRRFLFLSWWDLGIYQLHLIENVQRRIWVSCFWHPRVFPIIPSSTTAVPTFLRKKIILKYNVILYLLRDGRLTNWSVQLAPSEKRVFSGHSFRHLILLPQTTKGSRLLLISSWYFTAWFFLCKNPSQPLNLFPLYPTIRFLSHG